MNTILLFLFLCYSTPVFGWNKCGPCRCLGTSGNVITKCSRTDLPPTIIDSIPKRLNKAIQELQITGQQIKAVHKNNFEYYHKLEILDLTNNSISIIEDHAFKNLAKLHELILSSNELIKLPTNIFQDTPQLTHVYLNNNKFATIQKDLFSNLLHLEDVQIQNNSLLTIHENCFVNVPLLSTINLNYNELPSISRKTFSNLKKIGTVNLANNPWKCDKHLCEIMVLTINHNWDHLSSPACHSPKNKEGKTWREVLNKYTPTISVSKSSIEPNITLQCEVCSKSEIILISVAPNIIENVINVMDKYSITSSLTLSGINDNNNEVYSCPVQDCENCDEDNMTLNDTKNLKDAAVNVRKSVEEVVTTTKANQYMTSTTSSTLKTIEITATQISTASIDTDSRNDDEILSFKKKVIIYNIIGFTVLSFFCGFFITIVFYIKKKHISDDKEKQVESEAARQPLCYKNLDSHSPPIPPESYLRSSETDLIIIADTNETILTNSNRVLFDNIRFESIGIRSDNHMQGRANNSHNNVCSHTKRNDTRDEDTFVHYIRNPNLYVESPD